MTPLGVSRNKLARDIDVPVGRISDIVAGKRGVTPDTALRFAKYFGTTAELWLRLQADFDLYIARTTSWRDAEPKVAVFEPVAGTVTAPVASPSATSSDYPPNIPEQDVAPSMATNADDAGGDDAPIEAGEDLLKAIEPQGVGTASHPDDEDIDIPEPVSAGVSRSDSL